MLIPYGLGWGEVTDTNLLKVRVNLDGTYDVISGTGKAGEPLRTPNHFSTLRVPTSEFQICQPESFLICKDRTFKPQPPKFTTLHLAFLFQSTAQGAQFNMV
jgi:hypothetical protein